MSDQAAAQSMAQQKARCLIFNGSVWLAPKPPPPNSPPKPQPAPPPSSPYCMHPATPLLSSLSPPLVIILITVAILPLYAENISHVLGPNGQSSKSENHKYEANLILQRCRRRKKCPNMGQTIIFEKLKLSLIFISIPN